ncbi:MAG: 23S rRNA (uracil(1939)-C(5))-methyltransferase RlmD [Gammaproteobacteria bacterium]
MATPDRRVTDVSGAAPTVHIDSLSLDGRGVARRDGKVVFVRGALAGETVTLDGIRHHRNFDEASAGRIMEPATARVEPRCSHFGVCGGCAFQHLALDEQLAVKEQALVDALERVGGLKPARLFERITGPVWSYRRKARLGAKYVPKKEHVVVGFHEANGRYVTDSRECPVLAWPGGNLPALLSELIGSLTLHAQCPQVEFAAGESGAAFVFRLLGEPHAGDVERLIAFGRRHDCAIWIQTGGPGTLRLLYGPALLNYGLPAFDLTLHFLPTDFVQVNAAVNRALVAAAIERLALPPAARVLELYSGIGNFSLAFARKVKEVVSVEGAPVLVQRARANARANNIKNVTSHAADLSVVPPDAPWLQGRYEAVLLDPPRSGARAVISELHRLGTERILYVSCHPATLARDAAELDAAGFALDGAGVADMFPHTAHAEAMALFVRR